MKPILLATWPFGQKTNEAAIPILTGGGTALEAVIEAATFTELSPETETVGRFGNPNALGVVQLDAAVMDGTTGECGAVAALEDISTPAKVALAVMRDGRHVNIFGDGAKLFALQHGFKTERQISARGAAWLEKHEAETKPTFDPNADHDTMGVIAKDHQGRLAAVCTTSGIGGKLPGRVGDSPIIGSGVYCDGDVGACVATGYGEDILKVCGSFLVVEKMREGMTPQEACQFAIKRIVHFRRKMNAPVRHAALLACNKDGAVGAAVSAPGFPYAYWDGEHNELLDAPIWDKDFQ